MFHPKATIPTLLALAGLNRPTPVYMATVIATKYNHLVYFTPPYHPTLQPIELLWGMIKGDIARNPAKNATELIERVLSGLRKHGRAWMKVFRHAQAKEDAFIEAAAKNMAD